MKSKAQERRVFIPPACGKPARYHAQPSKYQQRWGKAVRGTGGAAAPSPGWGWEPSPSYTRVYSKSYLRYSMELCQPRWFESMHAEPGFVKKRRISADEIGLLNKHVCHNCGAQSQTLVCEKCCNRLKSERGFTGYVNKVDSSRTRKLAFRLSFIQWKSVKKNPCAQCNAPPDPYSEIDRINNDSGYLKDNVQPLCTACNHLKGTGSLRLVTKSKYNNYICKDWTEPQEAKRSTWRHPRMHANPAMYVRKGDTK